MEINNIDIQNKVWKVIQEDGETYLLKNERLTELYETVDKYRDLYKPKDTPKMWTRVTKNVYFKSPWGEIVFAPRGSMLCVENYDTREFFVVTNTTYRSLFVEQNGKMKLEDFVKNKTKIDAK